MYSNNTIQSYNSPAGVHRTYACRRRHNLIASPLSLPVSLCECVSVRLSVCVSLGHIVSMARAHLLLPAIDNYNLPDTVQKSFPSSICVAMVSLRLNEADKHRIFTVRFRLKSVRNFQYIKP